MSTGYRDAQTIRFSAYQNIDLLNICHKGLRKAGGTGLLVILEQLWESVDRVMATFKVGYFLRIFHFCKYVNRH